MASPETVRLSSAAAMTLGFKPGKFFRNAKLGCINLLMEYDNGCKANCLYCGLASDAANGSGCNSLIRVSWPSYLLSDVIEATRKAAEKDPFIQRICVSSLTSPKAPADLVTVLNEVKKGTGLKMSTLITPTSFKKKDLEAIKNAGAENITIAVDTATPELFDCLRGRGANGPHTWSRYFQGVREALEVMGNRQDAVGVHLIIGLGETEEDAVNFIQQCYNEGARVHLFSFFPEKGTAMANRFQPPIKQYRKIQFARYLIHQRMSRFEKMVFKSGRLLDFGIPKNEMLAIVRQGIPFMTTGCSGCNRPYANETPSQAMNGLFRNFPFHPNPEDISIIEGQLGIT